MDQHISPYTKKELMELLDGHGFRVVSEASILKAELILKAVKCDR